MTKLNLIETEIEKEILKDFDRVIKYADFSDDSKEKLKGFISQSLTHALTAQREEMVEDLRRISTLVPGEGADYWKLKKDIDDIITLLTTPE